MGKSAPKAPEPVDPTKTIAAQTASNEAAARLQQQLGMVGSYGPAGSVTYRADPNSPSGYSQYTELSPDQQRIYDLGNSATAGAYQTANDQIGRVNTALGQQLTPPQLMESYNQGAPIQTSFNRGPGQQYYFNQGGNVVGSFDQGGPLTSSFNQGAPVQTTFNQGGDLTRSFNPGQTVQGSVGPTDFSADRNAVTDSEWERARSRLDPMWNQAEDKNRLRLSNQGLSQNSTAYKNSMDDFGRSKNDAYDTALSSAIRAGSDQQQRLFDQSVQQGQFANNAAGQQYAQNMGSANFGNEAALADYNRNIGAAQFANQGAGQQYSQNLGAAQFGNQTAGQQYSQNLGAAQFGNQAVGQRYSQNLGAADFRNNAANTTFGQNQSLAGFNNAASAQQAGQNADAANFTNAARQANFGNLAYSQNMPIQQLQALLGTGQVSMPGAYNGATPGVSPADAMGAYSLYQQGVNNNYNARVSNTNSINQGIGQLGSAALSALIMSDRRMKRDITRVGTRPDGLGTYAYRYRHEGPDSPLRFGVMADEVQRIYPDAVKVIDGVQHVDYARI